VKVLVSFQSSQNTSKDEERLTFSLDSAYRRRVGFADRRLNSGGPRRGGAGPGDLGGAVRPPAPGELFFNRLGRLHQKTLK